MRNSPQLSDGYKEVQENDPLRTGTEEDYFVNAVMIALLLMETRDRHFKEKNQHVNIHFRKQSSPTNYLWGGLSTAQ